MVSFVERRLRWAVVTTVATALWLNRRDTMRWWRFLRRSIAQRQGFEWGTWIAEARVRAAMTLDPVLRADVGIDDVEISDGVVTLRTSSTVLPDSSHHLDVLRKVKGVSQVYFEPSST